jgi:geranylgeranyl pyrophosphate synthase
MIIQEFYEHYWDRIEIRMIGILNKQNPHPLVKEIVQYHFKKPGKRLRSYLSIGIARCLNSRITDGDLDLAASVELIHNASLIHDDLEDQDFYRRGELNVWKKYSPAQAINTGDLLFIKALESLIASETSDCIKLQLIRRTVVAINELIYGQMLEISFKDTIGMTWNDWENIAAQKTGALMRLIFEGTFLVSGIDLKDFQDELNSLGREIGILYQMRDDLLDAMGLKEGRPQGSDILEGKMTCVSIKALEKGDEKIQIIREALLNYEQADQEMRIRSLIGVYETLGITAEIYALFSDNLNRCRNHPIITRLPQLKTIINNFLDLLIINGSRKGE